MEYNYIDHDFKDMNIRPKKKSLVSQANFFKN